MSKAFRETIIPEAHAAEGKVDSEFEHSRDLCWKFLSEDLSVASMARERFAVMYVAMKCDCVALMMIYREIVLRQGAGTASTKNKKSSLANVTDQQLQEFERKYRYLNVNVPAAERLDIILDLYLVRERHMSRIGNALLEQQLGLDHLVRHDISSHQIYSMCSKEVVDFISVLKTFQMTAHKLQKMELTKDASEASSLIASQQQQIAVLDGELHASAAEFNALKKKYDNVSSEVGRQQTLGRLQSQIDDLENSEFKLQKDLQRMRNANQELIMSEARMHDQLMLANSKFSDLKKLYEANVTRMEPVIEAGLLASRQNKAFMEDIKSDVSTNMSRFKMAEDFFRETAVENERMKSQVRELEEKLLESLQENKRLRNESDRRWRLAMVAIAAKGTSDEEAKINERLLGKNKISTNRLQKANDEYRGEISETEAYVAQLQKIIEDSHSIQQELEKQLKIKAAENAAAEVEVLRIKEKMEILQNAGMSDEKQVEWDEREEKMRKLQERVTKLMASTRKYQSRVDELEQQVVALENAF